MNVFTQSLPATTRIIVLAYTCFILLLSSGIDSKAIDAKLRFSKTQQETDFKDTKFLDPKEETNVLDSFKAALPVGIGENLEPPEHLDAVRIQPNGVINSDYQKEVFLGNHEEIENGSKEAVTKVLMDIFNKADTDANGFLSITELEAWIGIKIREHLSEAVEENEKVFALLDEDRDGFISWQEYMKQFFMTRGQSEERVEKHLLDYDTIEMEQGDKDQIIRYKFRWIEADQNPIDNRLTAEEFLAFRHPEHSEAMMDTMVKDILDSLDKDENGRLSEDEFAEMSPVLTEANEKMLPDTVLVERRKLEFKEHLDQNGDGQATADEIKNYVDPHHPSHVRSEAANLLKMTDTDGDGQLSLQEVLDNQDIILGSKMVNTGENFHDEF